MATELIARPTTTTTTEMGRESAAGALAEQVAITGDLAKLSPDQRMNYYGAVCKSLGLNPLTKPFQYINLNGKLTLYASRDATDQLRSNRRVSVSIVSRERVEDVYVVTARAMLPDGRTDESTGVVSIGNLKGDNLANALMKAETKAKRRVTLSICGLGWMDETEIETVRDARPVNNVPEILDTHRDLSEVRDLAQAIRAAGGNPGEITPRQMRQMSEDEFKDYVAGMHRALAALRSQQDEAEAEDPIFDDEEVPANL